MAYVFALVGNQNSGKTTLFNRLTGASQHVGNWPGVTVERKTGALLSAYRAGREAAEIVDLPGIYSLSPYTPEEVIARDYIALKRPDAVINIVDATNLERNLYLTLQLRELGAPVVVALNMMDEARRRGDRLDIAGLAAALGTAVYPICARNGEGGAALMRGALQAAREKTPPQARMLFSPALEKALGEIQELIAAQASARGLPARYAAEKLLEGDARTEAQLELNAAARQAVAEAAKRAERRLGQEGAALLANGRYAFLESTLTRLLRRGGENGLTQRLDALTLHRVLALPLFFLLLFAVFFLAFGPPGAAAAQGFSALVEAALSQAALGLARLPLAPWVRALLTEGVLSGVGGVLSFLPTLLLLFLLLSLLEDSGYMARAAFLMDRPLRRLGLSGASLIPLLMGFGCTVPAALSARILPSSRDRRLTVLLTPFISCGAKAPVYALFAQAFFPGQGLFLLCGLYGLGVLLGAAAAWILNRTAFRGEAAPFLMELPVYRLPSLRSVSRQLAERIKDFFRRAIGVILAASVFIWLLQRYTPALAPAQTLEESLLGRAGALLAPLFTPLGFGAAGPVTALLSGLLAKESIVSTLSVLARREGGALAAALGGYFSSPAAALSFLVFVLLYPPCAAACAAMGRELGKKRLLMALGQAGIAWAAAFAAYRLGLLLMG